MSVDRRSFLGSTTVAAAALAGSVATTRVVAAPAPSPESGRDANASVPESGVTGQAGFILARPGAVARTVEDRLRDEVSVFDFMSPKQIASVRQADMVEDVTVPLQIAIARCSTVYFPQGVYKISSKIKARSESSLHGENGRVVHILGMHAGVIFEFPIPNYQCQVSNIYFRGAGCTGLTTDLATKGPLRGYLIQADIRNCNFGYEMAIGIDSAMLCCRIRDTTFGYIGTGAVPHSMIAIRSYATSDPSYTNLNTLDNVTINNCGNATQPAVDLNGGEIWSWTNCDFEGCGRTIQMRNISLAKFEGCWWERNVASEWLVAIGGTHNPVEFNRSQFVNNTVEHLILWTSGVTQGLIVHNCTFASTPQQQTFPIYDNATRSTKLDPQGLVSWRNNVVKGGHPANTLVSGVGYLERGTTKGWAVISTKQAGAIVASSDPGLSIHRNGPGDITVNTSNPIATNASRVCVMVTSNDVLDLNCAARGTSDSAFRIFCRLAGTSTDCTLNVTWFGA
jgi:hypothetical protein